MINMIKKTIFVTLFALAACAAVLPVAQAQVSVNINIGAPPPPRAEPMPPPRHGWRKLEGKNIRCFLIYIFF
jgi:hypothetical protein